MRIPLERASANVSRLRLGISLSTVFGLLASTGLTQNEIPRTDHGAADMQYQLAATAKLIFPLAASPNFTPKGIDAEVWAALTKGDGAPTPARIALGMQLYFDKRLSADDTLSCATCHDVTRGFTDQRPVAEGIRGQLGRRNAPTTANAALLIPQFWDGRSATLDEQARQPILNPIEMGQKSEADVVKKLAAIPEYPPAFKNAFGRDLNYQDVGHALAAFERTLVFLDAPFDAHRSGDAQALDPAAMRGLDLFEGKARCASCHPLQSGNPLGSDMKFHNIGVAAKNRDFEGLAIRALETLKTATSPQALDDLALNTDFSELGRFMVTKKYADIGSFKTPHLRNIGLTRPYMHDGSLRTLWDVMDHYNKGGEANSYLDGGIEPLALTEAEIDDVVAFLFAMTDRRFASANAAEFATQKKLAAETRPTRDDVLANRGKLPFEARSSAK